MKLSIPNTVVKMSLAANELDGKPYESKGSRTV